MEQAIALATENVASGRGGPFGAVIVCAGEVVATGANSVTVLNDPTAHAEVTAIRNACAKLGSYQIPGCEIYSSCEPCPMCLAAIYWAHCDAIYFGATAEDAREMGFADAFLYAEMRRGIAERKIPAVNLLRDTAQESFAAWEKSPNRVEY
jgi:tRNA(Arg) A34 adenosine deaminase TadA